MPGVEPPYCDDPVPLTELGPPGLPFGLPLPLVELLPMPVVPAWPMLAAPPVVGLVVDELPLPAVPPAVELPPDPPPTPALCASAALELASAKASTVAITFFIGMSPLEVAASPTSSARRRSCEAQKGYRIAPRRSKGFDFCLPGRSTSIPKRPRLAPRNQIRRVPHPSRARWRPRFA